MELIRRYFLKISILTGLAFLAFPWLRGKSAQGMGTREGEKTRVVSNNKIPLGVDGDGFSRVYLARNGSAEQNMNKVIEQMGGIQRFINPGDIVVLKPNAQWWNQGMTNTDAMKGFIDLVLAIPGFSGEIILAENHQFQNDNSRGWSTQEPNGRFNLNELVAYYQNSGHANVTKYHWHAAGTYEETIEGDAQGSGPLRHADQGDGYVWMKDCFYQAPSGRRCLMTYPVFTSAYSGIRIDLKNGAWLNGTFLQDRNVRLINFSALNHHGRYCGVTASVKNLMGVVDMTCGFPGTLPEDSYNVHHIGVSKKIVWLHKKLYWRVEKFKPAFEDFCTRNFHYTGGALGTFMREVRMPDLHVVTAERVGWGHRVKPKSAHTKTVLASKDPVALDYTAAREVLLPVTPAREKHPESDVLYSDLNNPDNLNGPFRRFLAETQRQGIGTLDRSRIQVISHDFGQESRLATV